MAIQQTLVGMGGGGGYYEGSGGQSTANVTIGGVNSVSYTHLTLPTTPYE